MVVAFSNAKHTIIMKKIGLFIAASFMLLGTQQNASAQIQKGNLMVGASLADFDLGFQSNNTSFSISVNPKLGYFIEDNIALGGEVNLGFATGKGFTDLNYGVGAFGRYYISDPRTVLMKHARFFGEANIGISGKNHKATAIPASTTNGLGIGFGPGVSYFITPNIGLEALLKYQGIVGFGTATTSNHIVFGLGFQIYLPTSKARAMYSDAKSEMKNK